MRLEITVERSPQLQRWLGRVNEGIGSYLLYPALEGLRVRMTRRFSETIGPLSNRTTSSGGLWRGLSSNIKMRGRDKAELVFMQSTSYSRDVIRGKRSTSRKPQKDVHDWARYKLGKPDKAAWKVARVVSRRRYFRSFENRIPYGVGVWDYPLEVLIRSEGDLRAAADAIGRIVVGIGNT